MAFGADHAGESGVLDLSTLKTDGNDSDSGTTTGPEYLSDHPAVVKNGLGVSTEELASFVEAFGDYSRSRILGTGKDSYDEGGRQAFEDMSFNELVTALAEELADAQNYLAILAVRVLGLYGAVPERDDC